MPLKLITFDHIADVPVHYSRFTRSMYGTRGRGPRKVRLAEYFHTTLTTCLHDLWDFTGVPAVFVTGGCYVQKAGKHGEGRAIDIDSIHWDVEVEDDFDGTRHLVGGRDFVTLDYPNCQRFYLAIEAVLRLHFGTVLNYEYNRAHQDHWHVDDGSPVGFFPASRARVLFLQAALTYVFGHPTKIDGYWGKETRTHSQEILNQLTTDEPAEKRILGLQAPSAWLAFLGATARVGFGKVEEE